MDETTTLLKRSARRQESRSRRIWLHYRFELFWLIAVGLGLFLLVEQLNIRRSTAAWLRRGAAGLSAGLQRLDIRLDVFLAQLTLSDLIGALLITGAIVAIVMRLRWRLINNPKLTAISCPRCGGSVHRVHRKTVDRLIGLYVPVRRYRCHDSACKWHGLRVGEHQGSGHHSHSTVRS